MSKHTLLPKSFLLATTALLLAAVTPARADSDSDSDSESIPFAEANVFFELNNTDGDLGIHALIDGEPWKRLVIETPDGRENLRIRLSGSLRQQGLTELFFESAEPTFDELDPEDFFARFPEGEYEVEGTTLDGVEMESTATVTHLIPSPPEIEVNGVPTPEDCDEDPIPAVGEPFTISWDDVVLSHPDLGRTNEPIEVDGYQVVVENLTTEDTITIDVSSDVTEVTLPSGLSSSGDEFKLEVLVREESGNQTATETCFDAL